ncbi:hypothetical protein RV18_GL002341 [Enterococcus termitis]|nr:hypothetical protein RV18_GL002341 [Enterococcus termitis]
MQLDNANDQHFLAKVLYCSTSAQILSLCFSAKAEQIV